MRLVLSCYSGMFGALLFESVSSAQIRCGQDKNRCLGNLYFWRGDVMLTRCTCAIVILCRGTQVFAVMPLVPALFWA